MTNIDPFAVSTAPLGEPLSVVIGQTAQWRRQIAIDPTLFSLEYNLRPYGADATALPSPQTIPMASIDVDCEFAVDVLGDAFDGWVAGRYFWDLIVTQLSDGRTKIIEGGEIFVFDSLTDRRTHAEIMVAKIESLLENRADNDVESYSIKSRSITKMSMADLRAWREHYLREISNQAPQSAMFKRAGPDTGTLRVRFKD